MPSVENKIRIKQNKKLLNEIRNSRHESRIWKFRLKPIIIKKLRAFSEGDEFSHKYSISDAIESIQLTAKSSDQLVNRSLHKKPANEDSAFLVYSINPNGSVSVIIYPHSSIYSRWDRAHYTIAVYSSPCQLIGVFGERKILSHIKLFSKVILRSLVVSPVKRDKFISGLGKMSDRYEKMYSSSTEERRAKSSAEVGLGAGLVGGLIASTILPFLQTLGKDMREDIYRSPENAYEKFYNFIASNLTTLNLLIFSLVLSLVIMFMIKRAIRG